MKDPAKYIPEFPEGCSLLYLSYRLGYITARSGAGAIAEGKRKTLRRINWLTLRDRRLVQREAPLQNSTRILLRKAGFDPDAFGGTEIYLSFLTRKEGNGEE